MNMNNNNISINNLTSSAYQVIWGISRSTTPEQFDELCKKYPDFRIEDGTYLDKSKASVTALMKACDIASPDLVEHIAKKNLHLLNQQNNLGHTALWRPTLWCYQPYEHEDAIKLVKILLNLGADPNIPARLNHKSTEKYTLLKEVIDAQADSVSIVKPYYNRLGKLLVLYNAKKGEDGNQSRTTTWHEENTQIINHEIQQSIKEINQSIEDTAWSKTRLLYIAHKDAKASINDIPDDIIKTIYAKIHQQLREDVIKSL